MQDFNRGRGAFMKDAEVSKLKGGRLIWTFPQTILDKTGKTEAPGHYDVDNKERLKCCVQSKLLQSFTGNDVVSSLALFNLYAQIVAIMRFHFRKWRIHYPSILYDFTSCDIKYRNTLSLSKTHIYNVVCRKLW